MSKSGIRLLQTWHHSRLPSSVSTSLFAAFVLMKAVIETATIHHIATRRDDLHRRGPTPQFFPRVSFVASFVSSHLFLFHDQLYLGCCPCLRGSTGLVVWRWILLPERLAQRASDPPPVAGGDMVVFSATVK